MASKDTIPLGYVELENGSKAIYPMNDIFLNYTFENASHWEALRLAINLLIDAYRQHQPSTKVRPIEGKIEVRTQFRYLLDVDGKTTRDQDIKITEGNDESTYIEFQNRANTQPPIEARSVEYFGLGIGRSRGKLSNQIWLLAEDVDTVLHGESFARYILKDEITGRMHPATSGIMYVSLAKHSQDNSPVGELAAFLLGKIAAPKSEIVKEVAATFNSSFDAFKSDKEAVKMLSLRERGWYEGLIEGEVNIANRVSELIEKGVDLKEIAVILQEIKLGKALPIQEE